MALGQDWEECALFVSLYTTKEQILWANYLNGV